MAQDAAFQKQIQRIGKLVEHLETGSDPSARASAKELLESLMALHGAALKGYDQVVQFLADHGARLDAKDRRGFTPLDAAMGKAGGLGFDGAASEPHASTAALLRKLMGVAAAPDTAPQR